MAKSIRHKEADTYHDAGNVYDNTQGKTQEEINASQNVEIVKLQLSSKYQSLSTHCKKIGNIAIVSIYGHIIEAVKANEVFITIPLKTIGSIATRFGGNNTDTIEVFATPDQDHTVISLSRDTSDTWIEGQLILAIST